MKGITKDDLAVIGAAKVELNSYSLQNVLGIFWWQEVEHYLW